MTAPIPTQRGKPCSGYVLRRDDLGLPPVRVCDCHWWQEVESEPRLRVVAS